MIAENVNVSLFGSISEGLYSARIGTGSVSNKSAYVVTRKKIKEYFDGVVVAVAEFEGLDGERPIVSTYGEVFYEPELRKILSRLRNIKLKSIRCLYEKSCGGIISTRRGRTQRFSSSRTITAGTGASRRVTSRRVRPNRRPLSARSRRKRDWTLLSFRASAKSASTVPSARYASALYSSSREPSPTT